MRLLIVLIALVYFIGIGVVLAPTIQAKWNTATASEFASSVSQSLPDALAWPARLFRGATAPA